MTYFHVTGIPKQNAISENRLQFADSAYNLLIPFQSRILQQLSLTIHIFFICFLVAQTAPDSAKSFLFGAIFSGTVF